MQINVDYFGYRNYETWCVAKLLKENSNLSSSLINEIDIFVNSLDLNSYEKQDTILLLIAEKIKKNLSKIIALPEESDSKLTQNLQDILLEEIDCQELASHLMIEYFGDDDDDEIILMELVEEEE